MRQAQQEGECIFSDVLVYMCTNTQLEEASPSHSGDASSKNDFNSMSSGAPKAKAKVRKGVRKGEKTSKDKDH